MNYIPKIPETSEVAVLDAKRNRIIECTEPAQASKDYERISLRVGSLNGPTGRRIWMWADHTDIRKVPSHCDAMTWGHFGRQDPFVFPCSDGPLRTNWI